MELLQSRTPLQALNFIKEARRSLAQCSSAYSWLPGLRDYTLFHNAPPSEGKPIVPQVPADDFVFIKDEESETQSSNVQNGPFHMVIVLFLILLYLIILVGLPILMIVSGSLFLNQCPISRSIPRWLIIFGSGVLLFNIHGVSVRCYER
ncbi:hypothetical protein ACOME3_006846 [Neoechinorhynchus agilis]